MAHVTDNASSIDDGQVAVCMNDIHKAHADRKLQLDNKAVALHAFEFAGPSCVFPTKMV